MWEGLLNSYLASVVRFGDLALEYPGGRTVRYGNGQPPHVSVRLSDPALLRRLVLNPDLALGEGYMDGTVTVEGDDLHGLFEVALVNRRRAEARAAWRARAEETLRRLGRRLQQLNDIRRARANVSHHYDLSGALYELFLDEDRQYSCAYFPEDGLTLDAAQEAKKAHIARKLRLEPGQSVLDIGCGWGGLALTLARDHGARVTGITLSREQHDYAVRRIEAAGLSDRVEIRLQDYREVRDSFDRIVSVGMFEHVGVPNYRAYFRQVRELLSEDGVALIHTIGRAEPPTHTSPFIARYIFPGGYIPAMSEMVAAIEKEDLIIADVEVWRLHYAKTLRHWYDRFHARLDEARDLYDERFCRMWRYYLVVSEQAFRHCGHSVFQIQLSRRIDAVPITRDYLYRDG